MAFPKVLKPAIYTSAHGHPRRFSTVNRRVSRPRTVPETRSKPIAGAVPPANVSEPWDANDARFRGLKVLVAGATGRTGREVVKRLVKEGVPVVALVRDEKAGKDLLPSEVEIVSGNVTQLATLTPLFKGCNAVVNAAGAKDFWLDPLGPFSTDYEGMANLVAAAKTEKAEKFVLVSSIGVDERNPLISLAFWGVLFFKKRGEEELQRSGIDYTVVRPGGLLEKWTDRVKEGNVVMGGPGTYGFPPKEGGAILRSQVADCCVEALVESGASNKVVEIVTDPSAAAKPYAELFESV